jgi:hypothetical protein
MLATICECYIKNQQADFWPNQHAESSTSTTGEISRMVSSQSTAPGPSNIRLTLSNYIADILLDSRTTGESIYHWIVQRVVRLRSCSGGRSSHWKRPRRKHSDVSNNWSNATIRKEAAAVDSRPVYSNRATCQWSWCAALWDNGNTLGRYAIFP